MSFITKRERVFNEYDLLDLPSRNEGKLKAYASCTDARAWSHFCSDKSEHLTDIIKRNNEMCRTKYVPTDVIVDTIMMSKNAEISRLKRKIEEFEHMIAAYDHLDLTCDQKCEIANAHAAIKAANKELDELCLDLDLSGYTEGIDSEAFETGKSRGDETGKSRGDEGQLGKNMMPGQYGDSKGNQTEKSCVCDAATSVTDPRIQTLKDTIINKDAKLSAMQNTIAVMENDVCEPYCIYAHIYTALEKIFGILCQNDKYKLYLNLLTAGKDTRCIDLKGKILFKLKVLEKFSLALIAPCSQELSSESQPSCSCFRAEIDTHIETLELTSFSFKKANLDNKRAHLVADIIDSDEIREILSKESVAQLEEEQVDDSYNFDNYNIENENLNRLKNLQMNYDQLMNCYESVKNEKDFLQLKCHKYEEQEKELENLRNQLREYNLLWTEKEHYRKRSEDIDSLKEQFLILTEETSNLETQLKAELEINHIKTNTIEDLRKTNIKFEKKINDNLIAFEKEKNYLQCKLKETECKVMCLDQQVKALSSQIDRLLEQEPCKDTINLPPVEMIDEMESLKEQIKNLKDALYCSEEEKQQLQIDFQDHLNVINELKTEIENWKSAYERAMQKCNFLEQYVENYEQESINLKEEIKKLTDDTEKKSVAVENLMSVINKKSEEVNRLIDESEKKSKQNIELMDQLSRLSNEKESELLEKVKDYNEEHKSNQELCSSLLCIEEENRKLKMNLQDKEIYASNLLKEIQELKDNTANSLNSLQEENVEYKRSLEILQRDNKAKLDVLMEKQSKLELSHNSLHKEKNKLEAELRNKIIEIENMSQCIEISKKESLELVGQVMKSETIKDELNKLNNSYQQLFYEKECLIKELNDKNKDLDILHCFKEENGNLQKSLVILEKKYADLLQEKKLLQSDFDNKTEEIKTLYNTLEGKIQENLNLENKCRDLEQIQNVTKQNLESLQYDTSELRHALESNQKESSVLLAKIKNFETLEQEYLDLKKTHENLLSEKEKLQDEMYSKLLDFARIQKDNEQLSVQSNYLLQHNEDLEQSLINTRKEVLVSRSESPHDFYSNIMKEIDDMKKEKILRTKKIGELMDKIEVSENIISNLSEEVMSRDSKISTMQNHINELEDEIRRLLSCLADAVNTSEDLRENRSVQIGQSLKAVEAHHSRATHNMKLELAQLQQDKNILEKQLSDNKLKTAESFQDKHKFLSQIIHLQNEREIIVTGIKQLELDNVGDSLLVPDNCGVDNVLTSIDRIRKFLEGKSSISQNLEQTLLKVQTSSQLLLSKADEAKKIAEKEKQKFLDEKEDAVKDRLNMEKQLICLKDEYNKQIASDKKIIKDLEAEISNQALLIDEINKSTKNYISKLEEELLTLQELYKDSMKKVSYLQERVKNISDENVNYSDLIEQTKMELEEKSKEIIILQENLQSFKNKTNMNVGVQAFFSLDHYLNISTQTEDQNMEKDSSTNIVHQVLETKFVENKIPELILPSNQPPPINEVQILTANVEPTYDFVRSSYLNYKLKRLNIGKLVQYSISNENLTQSDAILTESPVSESLLSDLQSHDSQNLKPDNDNLINIFNKQSMETDSSKLISNDDLLLTKTPTLSKSSAFTGFGLTIDNLDTESNAKTINIGNNDTISGQSEDKDVFLIFKDSEDISKHSKTNIVKNNIISLSTFNEGKTNYNDINTISNQNNENGNEDDSVKPILEINLQRVYRDSPTTITSDEDKKSVNVYALPVYSSTKTNTLLSDVKLHNRYDMEHSTSKLHDLNKGNPEKENTFSYQPIESNYSNFFENSYKTYEVDALYINQLNTNETSEDMQSREKKESHHKLARVGADVYLIKNKATKTKPLKKVIKTEKVGDKSKDFGLQYILNTAEHEVGEENSAYLRHLRKSRSDQRFYQTKYHEISDTSPSKLSSVKENFLDRKLTSTLHKSPMSPSKQFVDRGVFVKNDCVENYENKINNLTRALEDIEKGYKKKIEAIKIQYDNNIKSIINKHNEGVRSIQGLHEETLQDIIKIHENEVENLRSMSIEAMRKTNKLEKENKSLKNKIHISSNGLNEEPIKITSCENKKRRNKVRGDTKMLTKTNVEAFNVRPKPRSHGPCTCSLDVNISDTIRNIFEKVDTEQRKLAEEAYLKRIANKILSGNVDVLSSQELSFLHLKVCRTWKIKNNKEEILQKRIDSLENELLSKQRNTQQHIADLDRKVAQERKRLQEVRDAVCKNVTEDRNDMDISCEEIFIALPVTPIIDSTLQCEGKASNAFDLCERRSAGDLMPCMSSNQPTKRHRTESNRAVLAKLDDEQRREKKIYCDETPTRLRRSHDRPMPRSHKK